MIQSDFRTPIRPKTEGFSGGQFCLGVETLHNTTGKLPPGPEPVEQQRPMTSQHPGHFLHRLDFRSHRFRTPPIQKLTGPVGRNVTPEELERLLEDGHTRSGEGDVGSAPGMIND